MAERANNSPSRDADRVSIKKETGEAARQQLLKRDPHSDTDIIPADQFVEPGQHEFTPEPPPEPHPLHRPGWASHPLWPTVRTAALAGIVIVILLSVLAAVYLMQS